MAKNQKQKVNNQFGRGERSFLFRTLLVFYSLLTLSSFSLLSGQSPDAVMRSDVSPGISETVKSRSGPFENGLTPGQNGGPPLQKPEKLQTVEVENDSFVSQASGAPSITPLSDISEERAIEEVINQGRKLYLEENWPAFRQHFEKASRRFPNSALIQLSYIKARCCIELAGRYKDSSFLDLIVHCEKEGIKTLYDEVFANVQTWHVDTPNWQKLLEHGMDGLEIAFSTPIFLDQYNISPKVAQVLKNYCGILKNFNDKNRVQTNLELRERVFDISKQISSKTSIPENAIALEFICSMTCSLDPWSSFLTPSQISDLYSMIDGNFVGLGIELKPDEKSLLIVRVIPESPAERSGLKIGDRILSINGTLIDDPKNNDKTGKLLQGKEGSIAELQIMDSQSKVRHVNVIRKRVDVPSVENVHLIVEPPNEERVGYLKISCFQKTTDKEVVTALHDLDRQGMQCLIIDLRQNPGGLLREAIDVSDLFLKEGTIVKTRGRSGEKPYYASGNKPWAVPMVILIDGNSASASEIFAGAMHENGRAKVVGTRSYGKGTVQALLRLKGVSSEFVSVSGLRLTTEKFYSPQGHPYSGVGVEPDVVIQESESLSPRNGNDSLNVGISHSQNVNGQRNGRDSSRDSSSGADNVFRNVSQSSDSSNEGYLSRREEKDLCLKRAIQEARQMLISAGTSFGGDYSSRRK